jgi:transcription elongation GreA/GreB family factor
MSIFDTASADQTFILSAVDFERLDGLATTENLTDAVRTILRAKLAASTVQFGSDISDDIVTIGSHVRIAFGGRAIQDVMVGRDSRLDVPAGATVLELASPVAIALLGCKAGTSVVAPRPDGFVESIRIEAVVAQPERSPVTSKVLQFAPRAKVMPVPSLPDDPGPSAA